MEEVIGTRGTPGHGALMEWGVSYRELDTTADGRIDWQALKTAIVPGVGRGRGWRTSWGKWPIGPTQHHRS